ncbi:MAG: hypothetical protein WC466_07765 [Candidatus Izemoplasmatales bacterium]
MSNLSVLMLLALPYFMRQNSCIEIEKPFFAAAIKPLDCPI